MYIPLGLPSSWSTKADFFENKAAEKHLMRNDRRKCSDVLSASFYAGVRLDRILFGRRALNRDARTSRIFPSSKAANQQ